MISTADIVNAAIAEYDATVAEHRSETADAISDRVRREFEDRTQYLPFLPLAEYPSIYGVPGAGWLVYYTSMAIEHDSEYEEVYIQDLEFCDLADALAPVGKSP